MATRKRTRCPTKAVLSPDLVAALRFDKYLASAPAATMEQLVELFVECGERLKKNERKTKSGLFNCLYYDQRGTKVASVFLKQGVPTIEVKGAATSVIVDRLRAKYEHFVWKLDVCVDTNGGLPEYREIENVFYAVQEADSRLQVDPRGDPKHPERGFRCYLGMQESPGSACV